MSTLIFLNFCLSVQQYNISGQFHCDLWDKVTILSIFKPVFWENGCIKCIFLTSWLNLPYHSLWKHHTQFEKYHCITYSNEKWLSWLMGLKKTQFFTGQSKFWNTLTCRVSGKIFSFLNVHIAKSSCLSWAKWYEYVLIGKVAG